MSFQAAPFPPLHQIPHADRATLDDLGLLIQSFPVIDNHAHNLLEDHHAYGDAEFPFESIVSEAQGAALSEYSHKTLPHMRAMRQLAQLYDCPETARDVRAARYEWIRRDYMGIVKTCLEGTHAIMMDDGLDKKTVHPYTWHAQFIPEVVRIVRVENVATEVLEQLVHRAGLLRPGIDADWPRNQSEAFFIRFHGEFRNQIRALANDEDVRGFKSIVCDRTGLDISLASRKAFRPNLSLTESDLLTSFHDFLQSAVRNNDYRIECKPFNDYIVVAVCDVLDKRGQSLPFQFHTGLGDSDMDLVKANPAYMQGLIEEFPDVDFVLLHSSYPYTREAGYLASTYSNAWLDIGEVFPMLSRDGQEAVLKQALELAPTSKILWSTDGHHFPETYWLANKQFRDVMETVLRAGVTAGDYSIPQAINIAVDIISWNSNSLYELDEEQSYPQLTRACGRRPPEASLRTLVNHAPAEDPPATSLRLRPPLPHLSSSRTQVTPIEAGPSGTTFTSKSSSPRHSMQTDLDELEIFLDRNPSLKYIWIQYLDYTATLRRRMVTISSFRKQLTSDAYIGIPNGSLRALQNGTLAPTASSTGQFFIKPDLSTLMVNQAVESPSASVQTWWLEGASRWHLRGCPRWALQSQANLLKTEFGVDLLISCDIEVTFVHPQINDSRPSQPEFLPLDHVHPWSSNMTYQQLDMLPIIEEAVEKMGEIGIDMSQFYSASSPDRWTFPIPFATPLRAIDMLYQASSVLATVTRKHGLKATMYPRAAPAGSPPSHIHFMLTGPEERVARSTNSFVAGILGHMAAITAFTLPIAESYERSGPGCGGQYVAWGTLNEDVPLQKCSEGHYKFLLADGMANMYLGAAALLASGLQGIRARMVLKHGDCLSDPARLDAEEREELGIVRRLPRSLRDSVRELETDRPLSSALGESLVADYIAVKRAEMEVLEAMEGAERRRWLIERY